MRRLFHVARKTTVVLALLVVTTVAAVLWVIGGRGSSPIEQWVAQQIQLVAGAYLNPKLTFADLDYEFPATIRLKKLRLTADDPDNPGKTIDILAARRAEIELAEVPQVGQPVHIASIRLKDPLFQAVAMKGTHRLVGFSDLIRSKPQALAAHASAPVATVLPPALTTTAPAAPTAPRLSDLIRMRRVELIGGRILYDSRVPGMPAMELDHITTRLIVQPTADGWYQVQTRIQREPVVELSIVGKLNLDNFTAADLAVTLNARLGRENDGYLPPDLQKLIRNHNVQGTLAARVSGALSVPDYKGGHLQINAVLTDANVGLGAFRIPVDKIALVASMEHRKLSLSSLHIHALRGEAEMNGSVALDDPAMNAKLQLAVRDMRLDETIQPNTPAARDPKYGGRVNAQVTAALPLRDVIHASSRHWPWEKWGQGRISLDQARLVHAPVVQDLARTLSRGRSFLTGETTRPSDHGDDRASFVFGLCGAKAWCTEITYESDVFAARGRGTIGFDRHLDLMVNAGPLEKMQAMMGKVGNVFGKLTDAVAAYHVTGPMSSPQVDVQFAGGVVGEIERMGGRLTRSDEN